MRPHTALCRFFEVKVDRTSVVIQTDGNTEPISTHFQGPVSFWQEVLYRSHSQQFKKISSRLIPIDVIPTVLGGTPRSGIPSEPPRNGRRYGGSQLVSSTERTGFSMEPHMHDTLIINLQVKTRLGMFRLRENGEDMRKVRTVGVDELDVISNKERRPLLGNVFTQVKRLVEKVKGVEFTVLAADGVR